MFEGLKMPFTDCCVWARQATQGANWEVQSKLLSSEREGLKIMSIASDLF